MLPCKIRANRSLNFCSFSVTTNRRYSDLAMFLKLASDPIDAVMKPKHQPSQTMPFRSHVFFWAGLLALFDDLAGRFVNFRPATNSGMKAEITHGSTGNGRANGWIHLSEADNTVSDTVQTRQRKQTSLRQSVEFK